MAKRKSLSLVLFASNRVLTSVGQANFTIAGFTDFISKHFHTHDFSYVAATPIFLITSIPRALVTSLAQGSALVLPQNHTQDEKLQRQRLAKLGPQQRTVFQMAKVPALLSALFSGIGTYKFVTIFCEKVALLFHYQLHQHTPAYLLVSLFSLFSAFCAVSAYLAYTYDQATKGAAKILVGEWRTYSKWTWAVTLIHILGRAVFAKYTIAETFKYSPSFFLSEVLPNVSAIVALMTDFFSNIHTIHDLNSSLRQSLGNALLAPKQNLLGPTRRTLCKLTMMLGLLDSLNYGCGTLMTGAMALKGPLGDAGFYLVLLVFAPVSVFVNYAFNVRKGVAKFVEASLPHRTDLIPNPVPSCHEKVIDARPRTWSQVHRQKMTRSLTPADSYPTLEMSPSLNRHRTRLKQLKGQRPGSN